MAINTASAEGFLNQLDIDSAIGAFTLIIDKTQTNPPAPTWEDYLGRGIARCFNPVKKDDAYTDAIADLSAAIALDDKNVEAHYYRAYAYYMSKFYDRAIADCNKVITSDPDKAPFYELLGNCYFAQKKNEEAKTTYETVIKVLMTAKKPVPPSLFDNYRKVCEKMKDQD
jgi:tetratricopeptide (TPR) repeat protein